MLREKAGIPEGRKKHVESVIKKCTENSKFSKFDESRKERMLRRSQDLQELLSKYKEDDFERSKTECDELYATLNENFRQLVLERKIIAHVDMDAFYAQVETLLDKTLENVPMAVGGLQMLATSNYEARKYGVRAAMPGFIAKKLCPQLVIVPPNFEEYKRMSEIIHSILSKYDKNMISAGLDEVYLDLSHFVTSTDDVYHTIEKTLSKIKDDIFNATQLTCTIGVSHSSQTAKICSNVNKPNGYFIKIQTDITSTNVRDFMFEQPVGRINGVGNVTENLLKSIDVALCRDIYDQRHKIMLCFGSNRALWLFSCSIGIDEPCSENEKEVKTRRHTIGLERTFQPTPCIDSICVILQKLSKKLSKSLKENDLVTNKLTLKIKFDNFESITRCQSLKTLTNSKNDLEDVASELLKKELDGKKSVRLVGIRVDKVDQDKVDIDIQPLTSSPTIKNYFTKIENKVKEVNYVNCPICSKPVYDDPHTINRHVDECLSLEYLKNSES